ncbi:hypothetical protein SNEBB_009842 [Seison nebaliae]|nr:hypothetical protein SNEBB_009842 [Seison nebaliae]
MMEKHGTDDRNERLTDEIQQDWNDRESIAKLSDSLKKLCNFINYFDAYCKDNLAKLNEKLERLENLVEYLEATTDDGNAIGVH